MNKLADLIEANKEILATIEAWDNGKSFLTYASERPNAVRGPLKRYANAKYRQAVRCGRQ